MNNHSEHTDKYNNEVEQENQEFNEQETTSEHHTADNMAASDEQTEKLKQELAEAKDKYLRLYSEFENFRRRTAKEKIDTVQLANKNLLSAILPVVDDFERAEKSINDAQDEAQKAQLAVDAIDILLKRLKTSLEQQGVKEMESAIGKALDTDLHEAITMIPAPTDEQKDKIIDQVEKGYYLHDKVLRFAKVVVAK